MGSIGTFSSRPGENWLKKSLLGNSLLVVGSAAVVVAGLFILVTLGITQRNVERQVKEALHETIASMSSMASIACFAKDATLAKETVQAITKNSDVQHVTIIAYGQPLASSHAPGEAQPAVAADPARAPLAQMLYSPFDGNEVIGEIILEPNWASIQEKISENVRYVATMLVLLAAGIVGVIALVVAFLVVKPVQLISDRLHALNAVSGETLKTPPRHESDELGRLVADVNELIARFRSSLEQEHELRLQRVINDRLRLSAAVFEHSQEGITITDRQNRIVTVNRAFTQITGYPEAEVIGKNPRLLASGRHDRAFYGEMWHALNTQGYWKGEIWNRCKNGQVKPKWFSISVVVNDEGEVVNHIAIFSDISERKQAEKKIEFLAHHDPLTQLPNRILTRDRFMQAQAAAARDHTVVAMLYLDLDNFKYVNDTFGHQSGDQLLISSVERLQRTIRDTDTISRQGGDEFLIILPGLNDLQIVDLIAGKILKTLSEPFDIEGHTVGISASIGITFFPDHGSDFDTLLKNADAAMYAAKAGGRNSYSIFSEEMNIDALDKLQLKAHLRKALDGDQFRLVYQPQIDIASGRIVGAEALIRWQHPEQGAISPARFIPLAEESGMIGPIGDWVLEEACRQTRAWLDAGMEPFVIAVNISSRQLNHGLIFDTTQRVLARYALPPACLELEFTESGLLSDVENSLLTIEKLRTLGIKLAIDDFGTGYSSLSYLKQIKVDKLKIDQSFTRDIEDDGEDLEIIRAIIQLGKTLQLTVVAEGVETDRQMRILRQLGCHGAQGYIISRPLSPADFEKFTARGAPFAQRTEKSA